MSLLFALLVHLMIHLNFTSTNIKSNNSYAYFKSNISISYVKLLQKNHYHGLTANITFSTSYVIGNFTEITSVDILLSNSVKDVLQNEYPNIGDEQIVIYHIKTVQFVGEPEQFTFITTMYTAFLAYTVNELQTINNFTVSTFEQKLQNVLNHTFTHNIKSLKSIVVNKNETKINDVQIDINDLYGKKRQTMIQQIFHSWWFYILIIVVIMILCLWCLLCAYICVFVIKRCRKLPNDSLMPMLPSIELEYSKTHRMINALIFYSTLNIFDNGKDKKKFIEYFSETNESLLDDYIHIIDTYNHNDGDISELMAKDFQLIVECDIQNCLLLRRHYRNRNHNNKHQTDLEMKTDDHNVSFYVDIMDSTHCYLYHLYDIGMRVKKDEISVRFENDEKNTDQYFDETFSNICKVLKAKKNKLKALNTFNYYRFDTTKKYVISTFTN
eukprot:111743_1